MTQDNALERLMKKQKPKVPNRPDVVEKSLSLNALSPEIVGSETLSGDSKEEKQSQVSLDVKKSMSQEVERSLKLDNFETVRNTIRIESGVDESLRQLCYQEHLTKEIWLEAAYLFLVERPDELSKVNKIARERLESRKAIADRKRAKTMQERFLT